MQGMPQGFTNAVVPFRAARPQRGALLTVLLVLITLGAFMGLGGASLGFVAMKRLTAGDAELAASMAPVLKLVGFTIVLAAAQLGCAMGMWSWKKWGVIGYLGISVVLFLASARIHPQHAFSYANLIWMGLVVGAALPKWQYFED